MSGLETRKSDGSVTDSTSSVPGRSRAVWQRLLLSEYFVLYLSLLYFLAVWPFAPRLASPRNLLDIFSNLLPLLSVAIGQTFVLITAGIDLSVTSIIALSSVFGASVMTGNGGLLAGSVLALPVGISLMLATGVAIGLLNGTAVARLRMPPFMVTLTTMMFFSGFAIWLTKSQKIAALPRGFVALGAGFIAFIPCPLLIAGILAASAHVLLSRTVIGRWIYAIGHNPRAARVSGVPVNRTVIFAYAVSGFCAAVASILYTARLETGDPVLGQRILLDIIAAVVIGGTSLFGGKGRIPWTVFGVLFITLIDNSLITLDFSHFTIMIVKGGVILFAALLDAWRNRLLATRL